MVTERAFFVELAIAVGRDDRSPPDGNDSVGARARPKVPSSHLG